MWLTIGVTFDLCTKKATSNFCFCLVFRMHLFSATYYTNDYVNYMRSSYFSTINFKLNVCLLIYLILITQHICKIYRGVMIYKCLYICYYIRTYDKIKHQSGRFTDSNEGQSVCFLENKFVSKNDSRVLISGTTR